MREFHIGKNDENQRLDRFLGKAIPLLPASLAQKYVWYALTLLRLQYGQRTTMRHLKI